MQYWCFFLRTCGSCLQLSSRQTSPLPLFVSVEFGRLKLGPRTGSYRTPAVCPDHAATKLLFSPSKTRRQHPGVANRQPVTMKVKERKQTIRLQPRARTARDLRGSSSFFTSTQLHQGRPPRCETRTRILARGDAAPPRCGFPAADSSIKAPTAATHVLWLRRCRQ